MFSQVHIFHDPSEGTRLPSSKVKLNTKGSKHQKSFKDATNTFKSSKSASENSHITFKSTFEPEKPLKKQLGVSCEFQSRSEVADSVNYDSPDEYSDIETMDRLEEPDDYEDIMPKSERLQKSDIACMFEYSPIYKVAELTVDLIPDGTLDEECDFNFAIPSPNFICDLEEKIPFSFVEPPSTDFNF